MSESLFFLDTYAFFEFIRGNPAYKAFKDKPSITTIFNLAELNFALKREGKKFADNVTRQYESLLVEVTIEDIVRAMNLRMKKRELSIPDAIGYTIARRFNAKFLTGDKEFQNMPHAEFVR